MIPTTEEFFKELNLISEDLNMLKDGTWVPDEESIEATLDNLSVVKQKVIEFAQMHVQQALKEASENVYVDYNNLDDGEIEVYAINSSILNAYPLENIK